MYPLILLALAPARADTPVTINPAVTHGLWQGWGCSLAWWANVFGDRDDLADIVFTTKDTVLNGQQIPGLGMTIARYNVGGCSAKSIHGAVMQPSPRIPDFKQIQGYWLNGESTDPASASWDWSVDAHQRSMLLKARDRGADRFELFSNSPMWWMCRNQNPSGADIGTTDNLRAEDTRQHAVYLATVAKYAADHWGIKFNAVEAFNEPNSSWWNSKGTQEGCHFSTKTQAAVIDALRDELSKRGLRATKVSASDDNAYDEATRTWNDFSALTKDQVDRVNVHGYQYGEGHRDLLFQAAAGKELWNSEYGENDGTGMSLADNLTLDFHYLHPTAWCYWQPLDGGGWGLIQANLADQRVGIVNPKYFVLAQYSRHIRPGMTIIDSGNDSTVAAYDDATKKLVLVTTNHKAGRWVNYDLSRFHSASSLVTRWTTDTGSSGDKYAVHHDVTLIGNKFRAWFGPNSIQTFEIQNIQ